jgi:hypothetical protein
MQTADVGDKDVVGKVTARQRGGEGKSRGLLTELLRVVVIFQAYSLASPSAIPPHEEGKD